ncbi:peptidylprolyl isomerase [Sinimarinibacterium thermocellulolyticum]|uniref:Peptidylprolyl isomerase n=1 Tax=Sinimarinibacterium thermocellulolyticum TaxID=3170016 RepID=A0ABV2AC04_9GAMM
MRGLIRQPLLHFLAIGGLLFAVQQGWRVDTTPEGQPVVQLDAAAQARLRAEWRAALGREPSDAEWQAQLARAIDAELLLAEALRLELDVLDPVARQRLLMNMRFAFAGRRASEDALLFEARALGMPRSDPVVRRRLLQVMERRLQAPALPDEATLRAYVQANAARYARPARHGFRQIWFARADDARIAEVRAALARGEVPAHSGDAFLLGARQPPATTEQIAQRFGTAFAQAVESAPLERWTGPLASVYGTHFVFVEQRSAAQPPDFDAVRGRAAAAWAVEQRAARRHAALQALRARYRIELAQFAHDGAPG